MDAALKMDRLISSARFSQSFSSSSVYDGRLWSQLYPYTKQLQYVVVPKDLNNTRTWLLYFLSPHHKFTVKL